MDIKKFFELASSDETVKNEIVKASHEALKDFIAAKGLEDEAQKAVDQAIMKVAEAHGFKFEGAEELSSEELKAVAGGGCPNSTLQYYDELKQRLDRCEFIGFL